MEYTKCLVELDEILEHLNDEELKKIPYEIRNSIKDNKDKQYHWTYDETKKLNEQKMDRMTIAMLSYLNMEYLLNKRQKEFMGKLHRLNKEEKMKQYDLDDLFKNEKIDDKKEMTVPIKQEKCYKKIFLFIKRIFKK